MIYKERLNKLYNTCKEDYTQASKKVFGLADVKSIKIKDRYKLRTIDKYSQRNRNVDVVHAVLDGVQVWYVIKGKNAALFVMKPKEGVELSAYEFDKKTYDAYKRMERRNNYLKINR